MWIYEFLKNYPQIKVFCNVNLSYAHYNWYLAIFEMLILRNLRIRSMWKKFTELSGMLVGQQGLTLQQ